MSRVVPEQSNNQVEASSVAEEISQARARVAIPILACVVLASLAWKDNLSPLSAYNFAVPVILTYAVFGMAWLHLVSRYPSSTSKRRVVVIVGDLGMVSWGFIQVGALGVIFYPLFLWVIVGNGMRFGVGYLITSMIVGQIAFSTIYFVSDFWQTNLTLGLSLQSGMVILPLFYLSLMRRMRNLTERLAEEANRSRAVAEAKALFLANMSHELRTPMNGVLGIAQLLADTRLDGQQRQLLEVIQRSADSLLGIINDILDYSKVDAGKLALDTSAFDLRGCVEDVVQLLTHKAEEKQLSIRYEYAAEQPQCFSGDRTRIRQILVNLIGNAIKFTEEGEICVRCGVRPVAADKYDIELEVTDTGVGIAPENLERIFDQFEQEDASTARRFGGTGLGLAISRKLADVMGGRLDVSSTLGVGTTFTARLQLPKADPAEVEDHRPRVVQRDYNLQALVAEDNSVNQMVARGLLTKLGVRVEIAENGLVALEKIQAADYQLVFMDMQMPIMGGVEAAKRIRALPGSKAKVPIIALSANVVGRDSPKAQLSECHDVSVFDGFIGKPFYLQDLASVIDGLQVQ